MQLNPILAPTNLLLIKMKKIAFFALLASFSFTTVSCSGDDSAEVNILPASQEALTINLNGEVKNFESITISRRYYSGNSIKTINALEKGNSQNRINFEIFSPRTDLPDEMRNLKYFEDDEQVFNIFSPDCTVTIHNHNLLKGYFTGTYNHEDSGNVIINGSFIINLSDL